jgi:hypothetical protein
LEPKLFEFAIVFLDVLLADAIAQSCFFIAIEILAPLYPFPSFRPPFDPCDIWVSAVIVGGLSGIKFYRCLFEATICTHIPVDTISSISFGCLPILATAEGRRASFVCFSHRDYGMMKFFILESYRQPSKPLLTANATA